MNEYIYWLRISVIFFNTVLNTMLLMAISVLEKTLLWEKPNGW